MIEKLQLIGYSQSVAKWISNYLPKRSQVIKIASTYSKLIYSVPQGSHLGPLLLLFINDLPSVELTCDYLSQISWHNVFCEQSSHSIFDVRGQYSSQLIDIELPIVRLPTVLFFPESIVNGKLFNAIKSHVIAEQCGFFIGRSTTSNRITFTELVRT